ncbi:unnamed protein product [Moneuplotes crassus]|uniref:Uncharacterized protein n=1 Tax=Euplotes crassus TaxID=5936 RepID=A0AAD1XJ40_EUPCR|nr:unnamed protein product [Moneuplotes crassus]
MFSEKYQDINYIMSKEGSFQNKLWDQNIQVDTFDEDFFNDTNDLELSLLSQGNGSDYHSSEDMAFGTIDPTSGSDIKEDFLKHLDEELKENKFSDPPCLDVDNCNDSLECLPEEVDSHLKPSNEEEKDNSSEKIPKLMIEEGTKFSLSSSKDTKTKSLYKRVEKVACRIYEENSVLGKVTKTFNKEVYEDYEHVHEKFFLPFILNDQEVGQNIVNEDKDSLYTFIAISIRKKHRERIKAQINKAPFMSQEERSSLLSKFETIEESFKKKLEHRVATSISFRRILLKLLQLPELLNNLTPKEKVYFNQFRA